MCLDRWIEPFCGCAQVPIKVALILLNTLFLMNMLWNQHPLMTSTKILIIEQLITNAISTTFSAKWLPNCIILSITCAIPITQNYILIGFIHMWVKSLSYNSFHHKMLRSLIFSKTNKIYPIFGMIQKSLPYKIFRLVRNLICLSGCFLLHPNNKHK